MKKTKVFCLMAVFVVNALLLPVANARAQVLSVPDIINVLVSFSSWEKAGGQCVDAPFAFITRKDNSSVEYSSSFYLGGYGPNMRLASTKKIEDRFFKMGQVIHCGSTGEMRDSCWFYCETEIEVVSKTHVKVRQIIKDVEHSPINPLVANGTRFCEYRK